MLNMKGKVDGRMVMESFKSQQVQWEINKENLWKDMVV